MGIATLGLIIGAGVSFIVAVITALSNKEKDTSPKIGSPTFKEDMKNLVKFKK